MSQTAVPPEPSEIAGRYQVVKKLGAGAFGTVFKAKDRLLGRMVAIKTIRLDSLVASGASAEEMLDRFKREAMISAQLKHPNIVTIYDIGDMEGTSYLAMEFIDGVGLERVIADSGRLPLERAALIAAQVADALDFAHRHHVVHRDIKPANIMIEAGDRVKVTDFGIAKVTDSGEHLTMTGSLLGTPSYMSPEQARGTPLDGRSDLFAVGCVLYEMLSGKKAFRGDSITGLIFKIITEEPPPIRDAEPSVPEEMARIIGRALAKAPEARYQSGRELHEDLQAFVQGGSVPTLRQSEVATAAQAAAGATVAGATLGGAAPTQFTGVPAAAAPTYVAPSPTQRASAPPPPADPTALVGSAPPRTPPPVHARPAAPAHAAGPVAAVPARSRVGLVVGLVAGVLALAVVAAVAAWFVLRKPADPAETTVADARTSEEGPATSGETPGTGASASEPAAAGGAPPFGTADAGAGAGPTAAGGAADAQPAPATGTDGGARAADSRPPAMERPPVSAPAEAARPPAVSEEEAEAAFLDQRPPQLDGRAAGERVAGAYRGDGRTTSFGATGRLRARERFPSGASPPERRGVFVLLNLMHLQEVHQRQKGGYGSFAETLPFRVANPQRFQKNGYRFELTVQDDGYRIVALPQRMGLRALVGDDSGYVRFLDDE